MRKLFAALVALAFLCAPVAAQRGIPPTVPGPTVAVGSGRPPPPIPPLSTVTQAVPVVASRTPLPAAVSPSPAPRPWIPPARSDHQVLFFGDSLTDLGSYPAQVCDALSLVRINYRPDDPNRGAISGTSLEPGTYLAPGVTTYSVRVAPFTMDTLVILYGVNDFYDMEVPDSAYGLATWQAAWEALYAQMDRSRIGRVVVVGLPYMTGAWHDPAPWMGTTEGGREAMDLVTAHEAWLHNAIYVSLANMTPDMISPVDRVHPTAAGQAFIGAAVIATGAL